MNYVGLEVIRSFDAGDKQQMAGGVNKKKRKSASAAGVFGQGEK